MLGDNMESLATKFADQFINSLQAAGDLTIIDRFLQGWTGLIETSFRSLVVGMHSSGAVEAFVQAPATGQLLAQNVAGWVSVVNDNAASYVENRLPQIVGAGQDALRQVQAKTLDAVRNGTDVRTIRAEVQELTGFARHRAEAIARTEVVGAYNNGNMEGARALGDDGPIKKEWSSFIDGRTRPSHVLTDGQTVLFNEPFDVDGIPMDAPHDPSAPAEETINCRCAVILLYEGDIDRDGNIVVAPTQMATADVESEVETVQVVTPSGVAEVPAKYVFYEGGEQIVDYGAWNRALQEEREQTLTTLLSSQTAISEAVQQSAQVYQSAFGMFHEINTALRTGASSNLLSQHLTNLDAMFVDRLPVSTTLHRGRQFENARQLSSHMKGLTPGATLSDAAFVSTSLDSSIAGQFSGFGKKPAVNYQIRAGKGSTAYRVLEGSESEVLLPRNTKFRVVSVERGISVSKFDNWNVVLEVVE